MLEYLHQCKHGESEDDGKNGYRFRQQEDGCLFLLPSLNSFPSKEEKGKARHRASGRQHNLHIYSSFTSLL